VLDDADRRWIRPDDIEKSGYGTRLDSCLPALTKFGQVGDDHATTSDDETKLFENPHGCDQRDNCASVQRRLLACRCRSDSAEGKAAKINDLPL
jgi:hypothetical protein